jgi:hypothetical protein
MDVIKANDWLHSRKCQSYLEVLPIYFKTTITHDQRHSDMQMCLGPYQSASLPLHGYASIMGFYKL